MKKKAIFHNILGAFSNYFFLFLTSILLLPYYFKFISVPDYGIWLGGISFLSLFSVLEANISFILTQQLSVKWTHKNPVEFSKYFSSAFFFGLVVSFLIVGATYFFKDTLTAWVSLDKQVNTLFSNSFLIYAISLSFTIISSFINSVTQVFLRTLLSPIFNIISSIIGIAYTLWAIPTQGIIAIAAGNMVKSFIYFLLVSIYVFNLLKEKKIPYCFDFGYVIRLLKNIGLPMISKIGMTMAVSMQNFIVAMTISASATTIFDITRKLPVVSQMLINVISVATFTSFSLFYSEQKSGEGNHKYTSYYFSIIQILLFIGLTGIFLIGQDFVTIWVGPDKFGGNILLALVCVAVLTDQMRLVLSQQYYAIGKFTLTAITDSIFALSFIILAFILIPSFNLKGIVLAGIFANIIYFCFCFYLEKRRKINLVYLVINKSFFFDLLIIIAISAISKYGYEFYRGQIIIDLSIVVSAMTLLCIIFYQRNRTLFDFIYFEFWRKSKVK